MLTLDDVRSLLNTQPFVPFRLWLSDGGYVDVRSREQVFPLRRLAVVALLDPETTDSTFDRFTTISYLLVSRVELLNASAPSIFSPERTGRSAFTHSGVSSVLIIPRALTTPPSAYYT
jgi:hypothetical protein